MTLSDVKDFLKARIDCDNWFVGKRDGTKEYSITVYPTQGQAPMLAVGGKEYISYTTKAISVLVHWGKYCTAAEEKAQEIYDLLFGHRANIGGHEVIQFAMRASEPIGMGTDDGGIYEYVINFIIYYKKG